MNTKEAWRKYQRSRIKAQKAYDKVVEPAFDTIELAAREKLEKAYERAEKAYEADMKTR